jgi:RimJ/RimL family protein N-acetyltransferase
MPDPTSPPLPDPDLPRPRPSRVVLAGRHVRLEPIDAARHAAGLFEASSGPGAAARFEFLFDMPPVDLAATVRDLEATATRDDPLTFAVVDPRSGAALGRQSLMRIVPEHGVIEIGHVLWGPRMARTRLATEALYLAASYVFDELRYRRFEWKCNARNAPSRAAARRFGFRFEGLFLQHMWIKGASRDTAWFAMTDRDWPVLRDAYRRWLEPSNFDADGVQRLTLAACIEAAGGRPEPRDPILER